jgi:DNA-binding transcriptional LysR family regulator
MKPFDSNDLAVFMTITRHRSIRKAADEMGVSASALSHSLRRLEEQLGLRLFNRTTRSLAPTEAGARFYARIAPAFQDIGEAIEDLASLRDTPTGRLRINAASASAEIVLLPLISRFLRAFPHITVDIVINNSFIDMVSEGFDAGVRFGEVIADDMIAVPLGRHQRSAVVASPDYLQQHARPETPEDLRTLPCIRLRFGRGRDYAWEFERNGTEVSVEVQGPLTVGEQRFAVQAALEGTGIAYAFESQVQEFLKTGRLVRLLEEWCPSYPGFYLYYPSRRLVPAALRAFIDFSRSDRNAQEKLPS